tara:strand:- start:823 stop:2496 length:1674 start_codon:yes stop_codon:yes gene_type:complete
MSAKNITMIKNIYNLEWIVVRSEVEALLTEANLIKTHKPKYNIDLRDDKAYPFIKITNEPYPQVVITRNIVKDGSKYYGPFTDVYRLRSIMNVISKIFPIRSCTYFIDDSVIKAKKISLCLDYHINKCQGPCEGLVSKTHYLQMIKRVEEFIRGRTKGTVLHIKKLMLKASNEQKYEIAAMYRDQLTDIKLFHEKQTVTGSNFDDRDVIALANNQSIGIAVILRIRNGRIISREKLSLINLDVSPKKNMATVVTRFYLDSDFIPNEVSLQHKPSNENELISWLRTKSKHKIRFNYPQKGEKAKEMRITFQNAKLLLGEWVLKRQQKIDLVPKTIKQLQKDLNLKNPPRAIEAFDVSHLGGKDIVGSMVCFVNTKPKKSEYRRFKIKTVSQNDDFASMEEIVYRRYSRAKKESKVLPDLILIDGGKGQLGIAFSVLKRLELEHIPIIGLAKRLEEVYLPGFKDPQSIDKQSPGLILLRKIRDEAHRFAITYQKQKRNSNLFKSPFESIHGLGKKRLEILLNSFENIKTISQLTPEVLNGETKIPIKIAKEIISLAKKL